MKPIVVIIPTFRRPESLERAVLSVLSQHRLKALAAEVLVVDNDPQASAYGTVQRLRSISQKLRYLPCPRPGVSNARNAAVAASEAPLIAFLDDDEEAPPHWLGALYDAHMALDADVTFGPVQGVAAKAARWKQDYLEQFFSRTGPNDTRLVEAVYGCGNAMLTRATALPGDEPFDVRANETGGEDDRLFQQLKRDGRRFGWAAEAFVYEHAADERQTLRYALSRAVGYGQSPCQIAARKRRWGAVPVWMGIGAAQLMTYGAAAAVVLPFSQDRALRMADKAARGLGKVMWWKTLRFYGARPDAPPRSRSGFARRIPIAASITQSRSL